MSRLTDLFSNKRHKQRLADLRPKLYRVALGWCGSPSLADDLVQEASYKALKSLGKLERVEALDGWVFKILSNCYRDFCRKGQTQETPEELVDERQKNPEELIDSADLMVQVRSAVAGLKQKHREIIVLVDLGGFSYTETAAILNLPIGTVMSRLNRARQQLKQVLMKNPVVTSQNVSYMERVK